MVQVISWIRSADGTWTIHLDLEPVVRDLTKKQARDILKLVRKIAEASEIHILAPSELE